MHNSETEGITVKQIHHAACQHAPAGHPAADVLLPEALAEGRDKRGKSDSCQIQAQKNQDMIQCFRMGRRYKYGKKIERMKPDDTADVISHPDRKIVPAGNKIPSENAGQPLSQISSHILKLKNILGLPVPFSDQAFPGQKKRREHDQADSSKQDCILQQVSPAPLSVIYAVIHVSNLPFSSGTGQTRSIFRWLPERLPPRPPRPALYTSDEPYAFPPP